MNDEQPTPPEFEQQDPNSDPRLVCWFDGLPSVALAPRHSGGDEDRPAHWVPVCEHHMEHWHDETDAGERLPIIPRFGIGLSQLDAEALYAAICEDSGEFRDAVNQEVEGLHEAVENLMVSLNALLNVSEPGQRLAPRLPFDLHEDVRRALEGESNDAEHDALVAIAERYGVKYKDPYDDTDLEEDER